MLKVPTLPQAQAMVLEAQRTNPGPWADHSESTAENARLIAQRCPGLNAEAAQVMGLLHDIGRASGFSYIKHTLDGYRFLMAQGFEDAAAICLTHSFPAQQMDTFMGDIDVSEADYAFIESFIMEREYTEYDRLIQLCDAVSTVGGGVLIEKRLFDVGIRYGLNAANAVKWRVTLDLKKHFDELAGVNIYRLLPNIMEITFDW